MEWNGKGDQNLNDAEEGMHKDASAFLDAVNSIDK
jgi:hypothetical protein